MSALRFSVIRHAPNEGGGGYYVAITEGVKEVGAIYRSKHGDVWTLRGELGDRLGRLAHRRTGDGGLAAFKARIVELHGRIVADRERAALERMKKGGAS